MTPVAHTKERKAATWVWVAALALWVAFIWGHSLVPGDGSASESGFFVALLSPVFDAIGLADLSLRSLAVRKFAHFSEHAVLAILAVGAARSLFAQKRCWWVFPLVVCALVPCIDETIQMFIPGRGPAIADVCIDWAGCATGAFVALLAWRLAKGSRQDTCLRPNCPESGHLPPS